MKRIFTMAIVLLMLLSLVACGNETASDKNNHGESDKTGTNNSSEEGALNSPYQVSQEQWEAAFASGLENYTCDASSIDGRIYKLSPVDNLYYIQNLDSESGTYYFHKDDKVDCYYVQSWGAYMTPDEDWESHRLNATGRFELSQDLIEWLPGIYSLDEFNFSEEKNAYLFSNSSEYFEFYFEDGKLIRFVYGDEYGERTYSDFGTTEIVLPTEYEIRN